jgi:carbon-monoxide dehydrogenase large subunit
VRVVLGDTDRGDGFGSAGSRSLFTGGSSLHLGRGEDAGPGAAAGGQALEAAPPTSNTPGGRFTVKGTDVGIDLFEVAGASRSAHLHRPHQHRGGPELAQRLPHQRSRDRPGDGRDAGGAYSSVNDVGRVVNPMIVRGQLDGGAVQGIGQALCEHMVYDPPAASRSPAA